MIGGVFFVFKSLLGIERQKKLSFLTRKPQSHVRICFSNVAKHRDESHVCGRHVFVVKYNVVWCGSLLADSLLQLSFVLALL